MEKIFDTVPYPIWLREAQQLLVTVARANPNVKTAVALAQDAGFDTIFIDDQQPVYFVWRDIFKQTAAQGLLRPLIQLISDRLNAASPLKPYFQKVLAEEPAPVDAEPVGGDGQPIFIKGSDEITEPEALLYHDDLTIQVGKLPGLVKVLGQMMAYAPAVCKLVVEVGDTSQFGTGFRIGDDLLLTNWHVAYREADGERATVINAEFGYEDDDTGKLLSPVIIACDVDSIVADKDDDWAVVRVKQPLNSAWPVLKLSEAATPVANTSAYIIQHPMGASKRVGFVRNRVSNIDNRIVHYLTDTQDGSSGAPVFNSDGKLIALHHAGGRPQEVAGRPPLKKNEGIRISRIRESLDALHFQYP